MSARIDAGGSIISCPTTTDCPSKCLLVPSVPVLCEVSLKVVQCKLYVQEQMLASGEKYSKGIPVRGRSIGRSQARYLGSNGNDHEMSKDGKKWRRFHSDCTRDHRLRIPVEADAKV